MKETLTKCGYICVYLDRCNADYLYNLMVTSGITNPLPSHEMHSTVMYDKSNPDCDVEIDKTVKYKAKLTGFQILGNAIVVNFDSEELSKRFDELVNKYGYKHSYPTYECHMTLKYIDINGPTGSEQEFYKLNQMYNSGMFDNIEFIFSNESASPIDPNKNYSSLKS